MLRMFQFINHGGRIILYRNMAVPHNVHNHVILSQTITSRTYSRSHIRCRREKHPVHFFLFRQELPRAFTPGNIFSGTSPESINRKPGAINNEPAPPTIRKRLTPAFFTPSIIVR